MEQPSMHRKGMKIKDNNTFQSILNKEIKDIKAGLFKSRDQLNLSTKTNLVITLSWDLQMTSFKIRNSS